MATSFPGNKNVQDQTWQGSRTGKAFQNAPSAQMWRTIILRKCDVNAAAHAVQTDVSAAKIAGFSNCVDSEMRLA